MHQKNYRAEAKTWPGKHQERTENSPSKLAALSGYARGLRLLSILREGKINMSLMHPLNSPVNYA